MSCTDVIHFPKEPARALDTATKMLPQFEAEGFPPSPLSDSINVVPIDDTADCGQDNTVNGTLPDPVLITKLCPPPTTFLYRDTVAGSMVAERIKGRRRSATKAYSDPPVPASIETETEVQNSGLTFSVPAKRTTAADDDQISRPLKRTRTSQDVNGQSEPVDAIAPIPEASNSATSSPPPASNVVSRRINPMSLLDIQKYAQPGEDLDWTEITNDPMQRRKLQSIVARRKREEKLRLQKLRKAGTPAARAVRNSQPARTSPKPDADDRSSPMSHAGDDQDQGRGPDLHGQVVSDAAGIVETNWPGHSSVITAAEDQPSNVDGASDDQPQGHVLDLSGRPVSHRSLQNIKQYAKEGEDLDWTKVGDPVQKRKLQNKISNRIAQAKKAAERAAKAQQADGHDTTPSRESAIARRKSNRVKARVTDYAESTSSTGVGGPEDLSAKNDVRAEERGKPARSDKQNQTLWPVPVCTQSLESMTAPPQSCAYPMLQPQMPGSLLPSVWSSTLQPRMTANEPQMPSLPMPLPYEYQALQPQPGPQLAAAVADLNHRMADFETTAGLELQYIALQKREIEYKLHLQSVRRQHGAHSSNMPVAGQRLHNSDLPPSHEIQWDSAFVEQVKAHLRERGPDKPLDYGDHAARRIATLLDLAEAPRATEVLFLSNAEAAKHVQSGRFFQGPIIVQGQQAIPLQTVDQFLAEYYDDSYEVSIQDPSVRLDSGIPSVQTFTIRHVKNRFAQPPNDKPWNCLELASHFEDGLRPTFLNSEDCRLLSKLKFPNEGDAASRHGYTEGWKEVEKWVLLAQAGALTEPHQDSHGYSTYITINQGLFGYGWLSNPSPKDRKEWRRSPQTFIGGQWRYVVLKPGQTVFFPAGTVHFVFRLPSAGNTLAFGGHVLRCSQIVHWINTLLEEQSNPNITNEDLSISALEYLNRVERFVLQAQQTGEEDKWGGVEAVDEFLRLKQKFGGR